MINKGHARNLAKQIRRYITHEQQRIDSNALIHQFLKLNDLFSTQKNINIKIGTYISYQKEIQPEPLIQHLIKSQDVFATTSVQYYAPIIHPFHKRNLWFSSTQTILALKKNQYQIEEPPFEAKNIIAPWELDMVFIPLLAFDLQCNRLGMGGGYYDTAFQFTSTIEHPIIKIGLAYDAQFIPNLPIEKHDLQLDYILTPTKILSQTKNI